MVKYSSSSDSRRAKKHRRHHVEKKPKPKSTPKPEEEDVDICSEDTLPKDEILKPKSPEGEATENEESSVLDIEAEAECEVKPSTSKAALVALRKSGNGGKVSSKSPTTTKRNSSRQSLTPSPTTSKVAAVGGTAISAKGATNGSALSTSPSGVKKAKKRRDSDTSSDEERWLTAIESGKLDDVDDELKKMKDPKLMTARQRAMYERGTDKEPPPGGEYLMSLPTGYREKEKPQTAEEIQKAALKSQKRKQQADEKREKDKKKTMDRLLKKQESKNRNAAKNRPAKVAQPMMIYQNTREGAFIHMPPEHEFPLVKQTARDPPEKTLCGIAGCGQPKVYHCSKTNIPLCSLGCYRKNVQNVRQIMC